MFLFTFSYFVIYFKINENILDLFLILILFILQFFWDMMMWNYYQHSLKFIYLKNLKNINYNLRTPHGMELTSSSLITELSVGICFLGRRVEYPFSGKECWAACRLLGDAYCMRSSQVWRHFYGRTTGLPGVHLCTFGRRNSGGQTSPMVRFTSWANF